MHQSAAIVPCLALLNPGHSYLPKPCPKQTPTKSRAIQGIFRSSRQLNFKKFSAPPTHNCLLFILGQSNPVTPAALFYHAIFNRYQFINSPVAVQFLHLAKTLPYLSPQPRLGPIKVNHKYHFNWPATEKYFHYAVSTQSNHFILACCSPVSTPGSKIALISPSTKS